MISILAKNIDSPHKQSINSNDLIPFPSDEDFASKLDYLDANDYDAGRKFGNCRKPAFTKKQKFLVNLRRCCFCKWFL